MTPAAAPASKTAQGLARPMSRATSEGNPKIPLPMMELITSAARLHRPMARTSPDCSLPGKTWLYHSCQPSAISYQLSARKNVGERPTCTLSGKETSSPSGMEDRIDGYAED